MDILWTAFISLGGVGGLVALAKYFADHAAERSLATLNARYAERLAHVEHRLDVVGRQNQAHLDHAVTVSRVQFEEEYRSIREMWKFIARTRAEAISLVETAVPLEDTPDGPLTRFLERRKRFVEAHRKLVLSIDNNSPFYPEAVFQAVDAFRSRSTLEAGRVFRAQPQVFTPEWFEQRERARTEIVALADLASRIIRARLASIVIQEAPTGPPPEVATVEAERARLMPAAPEEA